MLALSDQSNPLADWSGSTYGAILRRPGCEDDNCILVLKLSAELPGRFKANTFICPRHDEYSSCHFDLPVPVQCTGVKRW